MLGWGGEGGKNVVVRSNATNDWTMARVWLDALASS